MAKIKKKTDAESLYLASLQYDHGMDGHWFELFLKNIRLLILIIIGLVVAGVIAWTNIARELNPEVVIPVVNVVTSLPGGSPREVEQLISQKLEKAAPNLPNIDIVTSRSSQSLSIISFQFTSNQDIDEAVRLTKEEIDLLVSDLPEDASDPKVQKVDVSDQPFLTLVMSGDTDRLSLTRVADEIKDKLEVTSGIKRVEVVGGEQEEVVIELSLQSLQTHGLTDVSVIQALKANNLTVPAGNVTLNQLQYAVALTNDLNTLESIRSLTVSSQGKPVSLGQVANVYLQTKEYGRVVKYLDQDHPQLKNAVQLAIFKAKDEPVNNAEIKVRQFLDQELVKYPHLRIDDVENFNNEIADNFASLQSSFFSSVALMFLVLLIFLGFRQALIASLSIPLVVMSSFVLTYMLGLSLNFLSLFSLLLALSLIGDDAIVMAEATSQYSVKFNPIQTGLMVFRDFFIPIWVGTLTVVWSFVPLLLSTGIIGEFIRPIPIVVTATLLSSTAIATLLNLPLNIYLMRARLPRRLKILLIILLTVAIALGLWQLAAGSVWAIGVMIWYVILLCLIYYFRTELSKLFSQQKAITYPSTFIASLFARGNLISLDPVVVYYRRIISWVVDFRIYRILVVGVILSLLFLSGFFVVSGWLKSDFFPATDQERLFINVEGPPGWELSQTTAEIEKLQAKLSSIPHIEKIVLNSGGLFADGIGSGGSKGNNFGHLILLLSPKESRTVSSIEIANQIRSDLQDWQTTKVNVTELNGGPPAGADIQINIKGESLAELEKIANDFIAILQQVPGNVNQSSSLRLNPGQISIKLNPQELAERNLTAAQVGSWLRTSLSGTKASETIVEGDDRDIVVYFSEDTRSMESLTNLQLSGPSGTYLLSELAEISLESSPTVIEREDNQRVVRVTADAVNSTPTEVMKKFNDKVADYQLPTGYTWDVGGANEENQKSVDSIIQAMGISFFLILITMVLQLRSFRKAAVVLLVIPLAFIGVIINFTIFGIPLSFPSLIGVLSLFGIVVNNALMLMDKVNLDLEHGFSTRDAIIDGAASRVPAIFLSSLSAVAGLLPITISDPLWRGLGGAIISGLSISGLLILFFLPSVFIEIYGEKPKSRS